MLRIGVDLGGTKIEIIALAGDGRELARLRVATPKDDYRAILAAVAALVRDCEGDLGAIASIGIGTPGSISRATGLLRGSNSVCLNGQPIGEDLERLLGREVRIANDANCFAPSAAASRFAARFSRARTPSPASGATIRSPGRTTTSDPDRRASAVGPAASKRSSPVPGSSATTWARMAKLFQRSRSRPARPKA